MSLGYGQGPGAHFGPRGPVVCRWTCPQISWTWCLALTSISAWMWWSSPTLCSNWPLESGHKCASSLRFFLTPWWIWWNQLGTPYQNISKSNFHSDSFPSFPIFPPFRVCPHPQPQGKSYNHNLDSVTLPSNSSCCRDDEEWVDGWTCIGKWELQWRPSMMKNSKWGDHEHWILCIYNCIYKYIYISPCTVLYTMVVEFVDKIGDPKSSDVVQDPSP